MKLQTMETVKKTHKELVSLAIEAMKASYSPYSGFAVGAALECDDGSVYLGCNIENAAFTPTICAERNAFFKAVFDGKRNFTRIAVVGGKNGVISSMTAPCGVCRQVMREFCGDDFKILMFDGTTVTEKTLAEILPLSFGPNDL